MWALIGSSETQIRIESTVAGRSKQMKRFGAVAAVLMAWILLNARGIRAGAVPEFRDLFNGKDLTGWVNVNTAEDTWRVENGMLVCSGHPTGVMRTDKQ